MNILVMILALLGGGQTEKNFDPGTYLVKQFVKGVYDETRAFIHKTLWLSRDPGAVGRRPRGASPCDQRLATH